MSIQGTINAMLGSAAGGAFLVTQSPEFKQYKEAQGILRQGQVAADFANQGLNEKDPDKMEQALDFPLKTAQERVNTLATTATSKRQLNRAYELGGRIHNLSANISAREKEVRREKENNEAFERQMIAMEEGQDRLADHWEATRTNIYGFRNQNEEMDRLRPSIYSEEFSEERGDQ